MFFYKCLCEADIAYTSFGFIFLPDKLINIYFTLSREFMKILTYNNSYKKSPILIEPCPVILGNFLLSPASGASPAGGQG